MFSIKIYLISPLAIIVWIIRIWRLDLFFIHNFVNFAHRELKSITLQTVIFSDFLEY
jgi:hypothetical protein